MEHKLVSANKLYNELGTAMVTLMFMVIGNIIFDVIWEKLLYIRKKLGYRK